MINGKTERFEKILRVRYKNVSVHKGRRAIYITFTVFYFLVDIIAILVGTFMDTGIIDFVLALIQVIFLGIIAVCMCTALFASDRHNNQMGIELRSGYDKSDVFLSRLIEVAVAFGIIFVILAIFNGAVGGADWYGMNKVPKGEKHLFKNGQISRYFSISRGFTVTDIWYALVAFIITAGITIGCSYIMNAAGTACMGIIFGLGISVVIMLASVGTFTHAGFGSIIPGYMHIDPKIFMGTGDDSDDFMAMHSVMNDAQSLLAIL